MTKRGHHLPEFGHRDLLTAEVVDPAQQRNVSGHACIMAERKTIACDLGVRAKVGLATLSPGTETA
jgi:hypothetical protein